jgi:hypothetical protein
MDKKLKDQDVLLFKEKGSNELHAVNTDKNGKVKSSKLDGSENPDFLKIDKNGNTLENFFENFNRQIKDPTKFEFFRVPMEKFQEVVQKLQEAFKSPNKPENKDFLDVHRINPEDVLKKQAKEQGQTQSQTAAEAKTYAISPDLVDWQKFEQIGITRENLEKTGNLDRMLNYQKTNLVTIPVKVFDDKTQYTDARLSLRTQEDGTFTPAIHLIRNKPELERPYFGVEFTKEDKENLLKTGNLGRIAEAEYRPGEKTPVFLSIDRLTNELVAVKASSVKVPDTYQGVSLNKQQQDDLISGKAVYLKDMKNSKGELYSGNIQYNADKRYFAKVTDFSQMQHQTRTYSQKQNNDPGDAPKTFRKKELTTDHRDSLREGKTVYVDGLVDKKGKAYSGYITMNGETGKLDFMFSKDYKDALAAGKVIPDDRHKVQVAKNNNGNTTEATKNIKEPLDKGQTQPSEKQAAKQEEKKEVKKSKGVKM